MMKSFFFTTLYRDRAIACISDQNEHKRILFDIEANPQIEGVKPFIKIDLQSHRNDEYQVLFMIGSLFKINEICNDDSGITIVKMALCSNENDNLFKSFYDDNNQETDLIGFVQLQCDMSQFLYYPEVVSNVDKLIENYVNELSDDHPDRIRCYDTLGNINFAKNDFDSSLSWYQKSIEITKRVLSINDPKLVESYNNIAFVYLQKKDNTQALETFKQVFMLSEQIYGD